MIGRSSAWLGCVLLGAIGLSAQTARVAPARVERQSPTFDTTSTAMVVDVVARDRRGQLVTDLSEHDFELYEDGVRQGIGSFSVASRGTGIAVSAKRRDGGAVVSPSAGSPAAGAAETRPGVVALVFDRLSPESRARAQRAALDGLPRSGQMPDLTGVFAIDLAVNVVEGFTQDTARVRAAVQRVTGLSTSQFAPRPTRIVDLQERRNVVASRLESAIAQAATSPGSQSAAQIGGADIEYRQNRIEARMLETFDSLERDQQGYSTTNALMAVVSALTTIEGRKTIVFFSEGLAVPPAALSAFRSVVASANRSNVSVYSIDAGGLKAESQSLQTSREIQATGEERLRQVTAQQDPGTGPLMRVLERQEDLLRLDPHSSLGQLSEETGGVLVRDTNDLKSAFKRIEEDMQFHYVLTYAPVNQDFDGRFREVDVRVRRPGVRLFSRRGYYAVRSLAPTPIRGYETFAIAALDRTPLPKAFTIRASGLSFPEADRPGLTAIVVQVGTDVFTYDRNQGNGTYNAEAAVVVRFRDDTGKVVLKTSQHYLLAGKLDELEAARNGEILFYRQPELLPGTYTVEAIVYDIGGRRGSARVSTVTVPRAEPAEPRMSSLVLVRRAEKLTELTATAQSPLAVGDRLVYPNLGEPFRHGIDKEVGFFFTDYAPPGAPPVRTTLRLARGGQVLAETDLPAGERDVQGRAQHLQRIPIDQLPPGTYELRVSIAGDGRDQSRSVFFTVE
jgi:VWFA-related protein